MGDRLEKMLGEGVTYIEHDSNWAKKGNYRTGECTVDAPTGRFFILFNHPMTGVDSVDGQSLEINVFPVQEDGKPDTAHSLNNDRIDATSGDIEELADTFARRLMSGTLVGDLFADITEARRNRIKEAVVDLRKSQEST